MVRKATPLLWSAAVAGALWLIAPYGFPNYDTRYALVWGGELAHGVAPDYRVGDVPTPHPLADLWGAIVSPLGAQGAEIATTALAYLALGLIAVLVYRLGSLWFDRPIGLLAAVLVLTRPPILGNGMRAYVDLPYIALVLAALLIESRRQRAGWPVLAVLALAGLLRPEAWLFSAAYVAYLLLERDPDRGRVSLRLRGIAGRWEVVALVAVALSAPLVWAGFDLATTGDPTYSFTATRSRVEALERRTGPVELVVGGPHRLGEVMGRPGLIAAALGLAFAVIWFQRRTLIGVAAVSVAAVAFAALACVGLAVISRYLMLLGALLCVFSAAALLGWRLLRSDDVWRRRWLIVAAVLAAIFIAQAPEEYDYLSEERTKLVDQSTLESDLRQLLDSEALAPSCRPITVPSDRAVPRLAAWLDVRPSTIRISSRAAPARHGYLLNPATAVGALHFEKAKVPADFRLVARNASWLLYAHCGPV